MSDCSWLWTDRRNGLFMQKATDGRGNMRWRDDETQALSDHIRAHPHGTTFTVGSDRSPTIGLHLSVRRSAWGGEPGGYHRLETGLARPHHIRTSESDAGLAKLIRIIQGIVADYIHDSLFDEPGDRVPIGKTEAQAYSQVATTMQVGDRGSSDDPWVSGEKTLDARGNVRWTRAEQAGIMATLLAAPSGSEIRWGIEWFDGPGELAELHRIRTGHLGRNCAEITWRFEPGTGGAYVPDTGPGRRRVPGVLAKRTASRLRTFARAIARAGGEKACEQAVER